MNRRATTPPAFTPKREHLIKTSLRLFYRDGYHAVGIDTILAESKLAKMTLYHHFASKEDLIVAVLEWRSAKSRQEFADYLESVGTTPKKRFMALFDWYDAWFHTPDFNGCFFIRAVGEYPELQSKVHQVAFRHKAALIAAIKELVEPLGVRNADLLARQIFQTIEGAIVSAHTFSDTSAIEIARKAAVVLIESAART